MLDYQILSDIKMSWLLLVRVFTITSNIAEAFGSHGPNHNNENDLLGLFWLGFKGAGLVSRVVPDANTDPPSLQSQHLDIKPNSRGR